MVHQQRMPRDSTPIAQAAGERFSATRFSLTGADPSRGGLGWVALCAAPPSEKRSTLSGSRLPDWGEGAQSLYMWPDGTDWGPWASHAETATEILRKRDPRD
jgi:hypothetical protein